MAVSKISDKDFIRVFEESGPVEAGKIFSLGVRAVFRRRIRLEKKYDRQITGPEHRAQTRSNIIHDSRIQLSVKNGIVLVGSDAHYWPGYITTAHRAFVKFCKDMKPKVVILNGDVLDGATISRHPPIGWESSPSLADEIETCQERLSEIESVIDGNCKKVWNLGNHDGRFETRIATLAPEFAKIHGVHLKDHFLLWWPAWSCWINGEIVIKHRFKGGMHAPQNNTLWAGKTVLTGHLHSMKVMPVSDYSGTRWGVDTGTLADVYGPQFEYTEDNPKNWRSGFIVLTFRDGRLMWPEIVHVLEEGLIEFRGELMNV